ncbi:chondroitin sulfate proteoglycan 4-like protein isoform X2 [Brevipalpus obovatus]
MKIDSLAPIEHQLSGNFSELNINLGLHIGGLENFTDLFLGSHNNFRGCIENLIFNEVNVFERIRTHRGVVKDVTFDCSEEFEATSDDPISFLGDGSYLMLPRDSEFRVGGKVSFGMKTLSSMGILFYITARDDFFTIELVEGLIQVAANDGNGVIVLQSDVIVSNGHWHQVTVSFQPDRYNILVDGKQRESRANSGNNRYFDFQSAIYVGGIEASKLHLATKQGLRSVFGDELDVSFRGCLRDINLNDKLFGMQQVLVSKQIRRGCVWKYPCLSKPCVSGSECFQEGFDKYRCFCDSASCLPNYGSGSHQLYQDVPHQQHIYSNDLVNYELLIITMLKVKKGESSIITQRHIQVPEELKEYDLEKSIIRIIDNPKHGIIEIDRFSPSQLTENAFTLLELSLSSVRYVHDGSDFLNDSVPLQIEFIPKSFPLPKFLQNKRQPFTLFVTVTPISDLSRLPSTSIVVKMPRGDKKLISKHILSAPVTGSRDQELIYTVQSLFNCSSCQLEFNDFPTVPLKMFTQQDVNQNRVYFVHRAGQYQEETPGKLSTQSDSPLVEIILLLTNTRVDESNPSLKVVLRVEFLDLRFKVLQNTGVVVQFNHSVILKTANLKISTNADNHLGESFEVKYRVVQPPNFGQIQRRSSSHSWVVTTHFSQRLIDENRIRYVHGSGNSSSDALVLQAYVLGTPFDRLLPIELKVAINITSSSSQMNKAEKTGIEPQVIKKSVKKEINDDQIIQNSWVLSYPNLFITGTSLLITIVGLLLFFGLCSIFYMLKIFVTDKSDAKRSGIDETSSYQNRNQRIDYQENNVNDSMVDDSGRGSLSYDRASMIVSETSYLSAFPNIAPSSSTNCSIRSNTPVSTFGRAFNVANTRLDPNFETRTEGGPIPTLFPLPPPSLYFGTNLSRESCSSSPRLYSFQQVIEEPSTFHVSPSIRLDSESHIRTEFIKNRSSRPSSFGFDLSTPVSWSKTTSSETDTGTTEYESRDDNQSPEPLFLPENLQSDNPYSFRSGIGNFIHQPDNEAQRKSEKYWI